MLASLSILANAAQNGTFRATSMQPAAAVVVSVGAMRAAVHIVVDQDAIRPCGD